MQALVDDLLLLARADERGLTMAHEDVDMDDLVAAEAERLRRDTPLDVRTDVTPTRIVGDSVRLSRMLRNLLDNAGAACDVAGFGRRPRVRCACGARPSTTTVRASPPPTGNGYSTGSSGSTPTGREARAAPGSGSRSSGRSSRRTGGSGLDHRPAGRRDAGDGSVAAGVRAGLESVADTANGLEWCWCRTGYRSCAARSPTYTSTTLSGPLVVGVPHVLQDLGLGDDGVLVPHQELQQPVLPRRQPDRLRGPFDHPTCRVECQGARGEHRRPSAVLRGGPAPATVRRAR